ncbi:MAG: FAD:protein FMN transferase [Eubacteriales bacterium SKADARSKE-1]|nr:FAD:protein FMN transferase [Eubacteriales bacterium SKADARSKE-1]
MRALKLHRIFLSNKFPRTTFFLISIILIVSVLLFINKINNHEKSFTNTTTAMGTFVNQTISAESPESIAINVSKEITDLENLISWRIKGSDIEKVNIAPALEWVSVTEKTINILCAALNTAKMTNGAFEPAILPVSILWDFSADTPKVPNENELKKAVSNVGHSNLEIDKNSLKVRKLSPLSLVDLGAVGKGAACDTAIKEYEKSNAKSAIISVGGSIGVYGTKKDKSAFNIAIRDPLNTKNDAVSFATLKIYKGCVSTSGSYERNFNVDGKFYHHVLDTKTGYPTDNDLISTTVYNESGLLTDILSTACYVLGKEKSLPLLEYYNAEAIFVDKSKHVFVTKGLKDKLNITNQSYILCDLY